MATIDDVARAANVSIATVSRYTNGRISGMSSDTQQRLRTAIDQLGYVPNAAARSLKTGRSKLIGVVIANIAHMYWSSMLEGIEDGCRALGFSVLESVVPATIRKPSIDTCRHSRSKRGRIAAQSRSC